MNRDSATGEGSGRRVPGWLPVVVVLGVYLTLRGYHSFDGDQAYRLPLLLHRQDPALYADDPFIQAVDAFNPHRGALAILDVASRLLGLPAALFFAFVGTFLATCWGIRRLADAVWPDLGQSAGWLAFILLLGAKAGNIGTNHLFEAMVLDRLVALALGWVAIAWVVSDPARGTWRSALAVALATVIHPSVGLQLAMTIGASWVAWAVIGTATRVRPALAARGLAAVAVAVGPGLAINLPQCATLFGDLPSPIFWMLSVELQNPQHMLPHLWRMPQWLAWFGFVALGWLGFIAAGASRREDRTSADHDPASTQAARNRLASMLLTLLFGLGLAWCAIERFHAVQVTISQPFRMATVSRGLALTLIAGRMVMLWKSGDRLGRMRCAVLAAGFLGDWRLVVAVCVELATTAGVWLSNSSAGRRVPRVLPWMAFTLVAALGVDFLSHHDTESGQTSMLIALGLGWIAGSRRAWIRWPVIDAGATGAVRYRRRAVILGAAWFVPIAAMLATLIPADSPAARSSLVRGLIDRCRFAPVPLDDVERLAAWCRDHTPRSARFIGPPGPKTFRLWSRRCLAFNRSGSPYHAAGLADWFARFADHVDFRGTPESFVSAYVAHRHEFESRYDAIPDARLAALAVRQGADHVIAELAAQSSGTTSTERSAPLELLHVEGRYAVYRVNARALVQRQP